MQLVHNDVVSKPKESLCGCGYFVPFVDGFAKYCWEYTLKKKSEIIPSFIKWLAMGERQRETKLQFFKRYKGGEYVSGDMEACLSESGMISLPTVPDNTHQNGVAGRLNCTLCDLARGMLQHLMLLEMFWAGALHVAASVSKKVTSHKSHPTTMPYKILFGKKPDFKLLKRVRVSLLVYY